MRRHPPPGAHYPFCWLWSPVAQRGSPPHPGERKECRMHPACRMAVLRLASPSSRRLGYRPGADGRTARLALRLSRRALLRVSGFQFGVRGFGIRVSGFGFRVSGFQFSGFAEKFAPPPRGERWEDWDTIQGEAGGPINPII